MPIPILIVAYDRPKITKALLLKIKSLPPTHVFISIDRANKESIRFKANLEVISLCEVFSLNSSHNTTIFTQRENIGGNANTIFGMRMLLSRYDSGLLLEDDCEFREEYIDFLNNNYMNIDYSKYMSLTPMNVDWDRDLLYSKGENVVIRSSTLMGTSLGMTFSRESIQTFDSLFENLDSEKLQNKANQAISRSQINFLQKRLLEDLWKSKIYKIKQTWKSSYAEVTFSNLTSSFSQTGWDSVWQLAAFFDEKRFLIPSYTVARESLLQSESSWHPHTFTYPSWSRVNLTVRIENIKITQEFENMRIRKFDTLSVSKWPILKYCKLLISKALFQLKVCKRLLYSLR